MQCSSSSPKAKAGGKRLNECLLLGGLSATELHIRLVLTSLEYTGYLGFSCTNFSRLNRDKASDLHGALASLPYIHRTIGCPACASPAAST